jgi:hypothetical protein
VRDWFLRKKSRRDAGVTEWRASSEWCAESGAETF